MIKLLLNVFNNASILFIIAFNFEMRIQMDLNYKFAKLSLTRGTLVTAVMDFDILDVY